MYKRQIYQIAESNRIEKIDSEARVESKLFFARIGMLYYEPNRALFSFACRTLTTAQARGAFSLRYLGFCYIDFAP